MTFLSGISGNRGTASGYEKYDLNGMPKSEADLEIEEAEFEEAETKVLPGDEEKSADIEEKKKEQEVDWQVDKLRQIERDTIAHEQAHMSAGGHLAGAPSYTYTRGPDGKTYITGGQVSIKIPQGRTPQETIQLMSQVIRAAMAPANPSSQDISVASKASAIQNQARAELSKSQSMAYSKGSKLMKNKDLKNKVDMKM